MNEVPRRTDDVGGKTSQSKAVETFDTPIPKELQARYDAWYAQLPKNLQYTGDYDLQGAWLEKLGQPDKYEATQNGHLDDYGKKPNHITFSTGSKWHDPKVPERTGGEWKRAKDGSWDFYPGTGNKASDDELKAYFDKYEKGNRVHRREVRQDAKGGDAGTRADEEGGDGGSETAVSETTVSNAPAPQQGGPRIVVNPTVFEDDKDALCVAFNEAFRIVMEDMAFDPVSEPTERQRKFFSDTAYADDETQLRRTILARICTFDTSVKDPTDEQLQEAVEFLENVMEAGYPQDEREQSMVQRIHDVVMQSVGRPRSEETEEPPSDEGTVQAAIGGGETEEEKPDFYDGAGVQGETLADAWLERFQNRFGKYLPEGWNFRINGGWSPENDMGSDKVPILLYDANDTPVAGAVISDEDVNSPGVYDMSSPAGTWIHPLKSVRENSGNKISPQDLDTDAVYAGEWGVKEENNLKFFRSLPGYQEPPKPEPPKPEPPKPEPPKPEPPKPAVAPQQNNGQWVDARGAQNFRDPKDAVDRGENQRRQAWRQYELQQKRDLRRVLRNMTPGMNVSAALKATQGMDDHEANQWFLQAHRAARNGMPTPTRAAFPPLVPPLDPNDPNDPRNQNWP